MLMLLAAVDFPWLLHTGIAENKNRKNPLQYPQKAQFLQLLETCQALHSTFFAIASCRDTLDLLQRLLERLDMSML